MLLVYSFSGYPIVKAWIFIRFSGEFMPPPVTLTMVSGGGGHVCNIVGLLDQVPIV